MNDIIWRVYLKDSDEFWNFKTRFGARRFLRRQCHPECFYIKKVILQRGPLKWF